ncbi:MAG TPA: hypothetical protein VE242_08075 [Chthoniobacterales bacterium]|nr:hypothetical protein [Chthoniobacterales bacterium]
MPQQFRFRSSAKEMGYCLALLVTCILAVSGCAHSKKTTDQPPVKKQWNNVHTAPAKFDRYTGGFEEPWPFGPGP